MRDLKLLGRRYNAAFYAYHKIARENMERALGGQHPTEELLILESRARDTLEAARQALLESLRAIEALPK